MPATNQQTTGSNEITAPDSSKIPVVLDTSLIKISPVTPVIQASAYSTGNVMGGTLTFPLAVRYAGGSGQAIGAILTAKTAFAGPADLILFSKLPVGTYTDKAAITLANADVPNVLGVLHLSDLTATGATITGILQHAVTQQPIPVINNDTTPSQNIYGVLVVRAAITPAAVDDVVVKLVIDQN